VGAGEFLGLVCMGHRDLTHHGAFSLIWQGERRAPKVSTFRAQVQTRLLRTLGGDSSKELQPWTARI
jgi:hypothetical protein